MRRVPEVIDCWYDSGSMPFAQWGFPNRPGSGEQFRKNFPADFISEAIDQTRGWFYSQLAISTLLFGDELKSEIANLKSEIADLKHPYPHPFRNCIVLGLMLGEDGGKMSKSKRNYREPGEIFDRYGADALRWYFFANQPPWTSIRYSEQSIKDSIPEFLLRLWNVYSFFVIYANIDGFDPGALLAGKAGQLDSLSQAKTYRALGERSELDRWIVSELNRTAADVTQRMDAYDNYGACQAITTYVDALSNWYVRRSRDRFWSDQHDTDKQDAYWTIYECLIATSKLIAPFVPYLADSVWQNLARVPFGERAAESVHLCDFPTGHATAIDEQLSARMSLVRDIVSLGRAARMDSKLKVRQPLSKVEVVLTDHTHQAWLEEHGALVCEELNVKQVEFPPKADQYVSYTVLPDLKRLGPKLGKRLPELRKKLAEADAAQLLDQMSAAGTATLELSDGPVTLDSQDLQVRLQARPGWAAAHGPCGVVVLSTEITPALAAEGLARELVHAIQGRRRDLDCKYTDRIAVGLVTESAELREAAQQFADYIRAETLATELKFAPLAGAESVSIKLGAHEVAISLRPI
jgi:isoleucyl-tRNA synthetase